MAINRRHFVQGALVLGFTGVAMRSRAGYCGSTPSLYMPGGQVPSLEKHAIIVFCGEDVRLSSALHLLQKGNAPALMVSGIDPATWQARAKDLPQNLLDRITPDYTAQNTQENAANSTRWLAKNGFEKAVLVTADYHMERSLTLMAACDNRLNLTQYPVAAEIGFGTWLGEQVKLASTRLGFGGIPGMQLG